MNIAPRFARGLALLALAIMATAASAKTPLTEIIPSDTGALFCADVFRLKSSPLADRVIGSGSHITADRDFDQLMNDMGLTLRRDIDKIVIAVVPAADHAAPSGILVGADGRFDPSKINRALGSRGATAVAVPGGTIYRVPQDRSGHPASTAGPDPASSPKSDPDLFVAIPSSSRLLFGTESELTRALSSTLSDSPLSSGRGIGKLAGMAKTSAAAWFVVDTSQFISSSADKKNHPEASGRQDAAANAIRSLATVTGLSGSFEPGRNVEVRLSARTDTDENADLVEDSIRGLLAIWRLAAVDRSPELVTALRKFKVDHTGTVVTLEGTVLSADLEKFLEQRTAAQARAADAQTPDH